MKKLFFLVTALCLILSACLPAPTQPQATSPAPNLVATADILSQQTLQALPTQTVALSITPVIATPAPSDTPTQATTSTETQNPILLTLTATLGTGTAAISSETSLLGTPGAPTVTGTLPLTTTPSNTPNPAFSITPTGTPHKQYSGTMPPDLPFGDITLINKAKAEVYISLRCVTKDNYVTIIEYPVKGTITTRAPLGQYTYVTWVGGRKIIGNFSLTSTKDLTIKIYRDRVEIK